MCKYNNLAEKNTYISEWKCITPTSGVCFQPAMFLTESWIDGDDYYFHYYIVIIITTIIIVISVITIINHYESVSIDLEKTWWWLHLSMMMRQSPKDLFFAILHPDAFVLAR